MGSLAGNSKDPKSPFADIRVRRAISYAIDEKGLASAFGYGYYKPMNQWAAIGSWANSPAVVGYPYNPQKAKELLAQAGYRIRTQDDHALLQPRPSLHGRDDGGPTLL